MGQPGEGLCSASQALWLLFSMATFRRPQARGQIRHPPIISCQALGSRWRLEAKHRYPRGAFPHQECRFRLAKLQKTKDTRLGSPRQGLSNELVL